MKLTVVLQRYPADSPHAGRLYAHVLQDGIKRGRNLLAGHRLTGVSYAQTVVTQELNDDVPGVPLDITWRLPWNFCGAVKALADHARGRNGHEPLIAQTLERCAEELRHLEERGGAPELSPDVMARSASSNKRSL
jgi:hypothetical protein